MSVPYYASSEWRDRTFKVSNAAQGAWLRALQDHPTLEHAAFAHLLRIDEWGDFVRELFTMLWKPSDAGRAIEPDITGQWIKTARTAVEMQACWPALRVAGQAHRYIAASAAATLANAVASALNIEKIEPDTVACEHPDVLSSREQALEDELQSLVEGREPGTMPDVRHIDEAVAGLGAAYASSLGRRNALQRAADKLDPEALTAAVNAALAQATRAVAAVQAGRGFGLHNDEITGSEGEMPTELLELIMKDARLRRILDLIGKMKDRYAAVGKAEVSNGVQNLVGIETGDDPQRLVPSEVARLSHPLLGLELMARMLDKGATVWKLRGVRRRAQGDITLVCDYSSSMDGERIVWLRALAGAALMIALREKRRVNLVTYADTASSIVVEPGNREQLARALHVLAEPTRGGTNGPAAIIEACSFKPQGKGRPDICVLSDGDFPPPGSSPGEEHERAGALVRAFRKTGGRITMIGIECRIDEHADWTDERWHVSGNALDGSTGGDLLSAMFESKE
jgi:hypothetical protein